MALKRLEKNRQNQEGTVFVTTLVTMFLIILTGAQFFTMSSRSLAYIKSLERSTQAKYLADAALARMYGALNNSFSTSTAYANQSLGLGTYSASVKLNSGRYLVSATGTVQGVSRTSTAEVIPPQVTAFSYVLASGDEIEIELKSSNSTGTITGNIYSGGDTKLKTHPTSGSLAITGNVQAAGSISIQNNVTISGSQTSNYSSSINFPTPDFSYYQSIAQANGYYYNGNKSYSNASAIPSTPAGGVIYVKGNINITGVQSTTACIVATGNIQISKSSGIYPQVTITNANSYPAFLVGGNLHYSTNGNGNGYLKVTGLIFTNGEIEFKSANHDTFTLNGSAVARGEIEIEPTAWSTVSVTYSAPNPPGFNTGSSQMTIASYNS